MGLVVFFHGFTGHADSWNEIAGSLPDERALAVVLWGHDYAANSAPGVVDFVDEVDRLASLVRQTRSSSGERVTLCGYSLGARVALGILARHPGLASAALLIGVHPGLKTPEERRARAEADEVWSVLAEEGGTNAFLEAWQAQPIFGSQRRLPPDVLARQHALRARHPGRALAAGMRSLGLGGMPSFWGDLPKIAIPVRLIAGELDGKFVAVAEQMLPALPSGSLAVVEGCGHNVVLERPEAVAIELRDLARRP